MAKHLVFIIGTRAQLIKVAPVIAACERLSLPCTLLMTGQHQETMQDLIAEFAIESPQVPAVQADEHSTIASLLRWLPAAYKGVRNKLRELASADADISVLVHGDTLSTLVGAFAARLHKTRVVHVESGLSSGRWLDPFPEEICRRMVFRMTDVAICPNKQAMVYMAKHHPRARILDSQGNTIVDAVALTGASSILPDLASPYLVASLHRFQNIYEAGRLAALVALMKDLSDHVDVRFVLHPATRVRLEKQGLFSSLSASSRIHLMPRMGYGDFLRMAAGAQCVLTDGGSNQEELAALGVPTIIMRERTERPDGLGANALLEADAPGGIYRFIVDGGVANLRTRPAALSGVGPSARIAQALAS
ncbi:UDP-N-acetylglucosamine 2-epimerase [Rhodanobacter caeni]